MPRHYYFLTFIYLCDRSPLVKLHDGKRWKFESENEKQMLYAEESVREAFDVTQ